MSIDPLKPLDQVVIGDERWGLFHRTLEGHHALISSIELIEAVPENVRQHFENARNAWLYAFFAYRLLAVALLTIHMTCEVALRERAKQEGLSERKSKSLDGLMRHAIARRWLVDSDFAAWADRERHWEENRQARLAMGEPDCGPFVEPIDNQVHAKDLVKVIRQSRNALAHGESILVPNLSHVFQAVADVINQLFPAGRSERVGQKSESE